MIVLLCLETPAPGRASRAALAIACALAETSPAAAVVALSAGGARNSPAMALARSCAALSRIVHIDDPGLDKADFMTTGMVLAEAARHLAASVVLVGERSDDEGQGLVPAALAHHLRAPLLSRVQGVRLSADPDTVEVSLRACGQHCTVAARAPTVLAACACLGGGPTLPGTQVRDVEELGLASIGVDSSRMVPRPDLLGAFVPKPVPGPREMALAEACVALQRHR